MSESFAGKVFDGDKVFVENVQGTISHDPAGPFTTWAGTLDVSTEEGMRLLSRLTLRLVLPDGRSGDFFMTGPRTFRGTGPLK